jgi:hypothetical protein
MIRFVDYIKLVESQKDETKCPHPEDKDFCKKWRLYIDGKGEMPIYSKSASIGHYTGPRASKMVHAKEKLKRSKGKKGSKTDWRKNL